jgi:hypothetical protein
MLDAMWAVRQDSRFVQAVNDVASIARNQNTIDAMQGYLVTTKATPSAKPTRPVRKPKPHRNPNTEVIQIL